MPERPVGWLSPIHRAIALLAPRAWLAVAHRQRLALSLLGAALAVSAAIAAGNLLALGGGALVVGGGYAVGRRRERRFSARYVDGSTGLFNGRCLDRCYPSLVRRSRCGDAIALIALDFSMAANDREMGAVIEGLRRCTRAGDLVFKLSPQRLVVVATRNERGGHELLAVRLRMRAHACLAPERAVATQVTARSTLVGDPIPTRAATLPTLPLRPASLG